MRRGCFDTGLIYAAITIPEVVWLMIITFYITSVLYFAIWDIYIPCWQKALHVDIHTPSTCAVETLSDIMSRHVTVHSAFELLLDKHISRICE